MNQTMAGYAEDSAYFYAPNKGGPIAFAILFLASGIIHFIQSWHYRSWTFTGVMPWASLLLTIGFILRGVGAFHYDNIEIMIANTVLIISGPSIYALVNYLVLSRILYYVPYLSPLHPGRVLTTFLAFDITTEIIIVQGAWRVAANKEVHAGSILIKVGLTLQCLMFLFFLALGLNFQRKARKAGIKNKKLNTVLNILYISCIIITLRCIYRMVEYFEGYDGYVFRHEWMFYIFEAALMFVNTAMLNFFHPGRYLPRSHKIFLAKDGQTELIGPGWESKRFWLWTFIDPFDIVGIVTRQDKKNRYWELPLDELDRQARQAQAKESQAREKLRKYLPFVPKYRSDFADEKDGSS